MNRSITQTEWIREAEDQSIYLANTIPTVWSTVKPMRRRTPSKSIQHYENLIYSARDGIIVEPNYLVKRSAVGVLRRKRSALHTLM